MSFLEVIGHGSAQARPDASIISLSVNTERPSAQEAMVEANRAMSAAVEVARSLGLQPRHLQTQGVSLYEHRADPTTNTPAQFSARQSLRVTLPVRAETALPSSAQFIDAVLQAVGNALNIDSVEWVVTDPTAARRQARDRAWEDALHAGQQIAGRANRGIGRVLTVIDHSSAASSGPTVMRAMAAPVEPGEDVITAELTVRWEWAAGPGESRTARP